MTRTSTVGFLAYPFWFLCKLCILSSFFIGSLPPSISIPLSFHFSLTHLICKIIWLVVSVTLAYQSRHLLVYHIMRELDCLQTTLNSVSGHSCSHISCLNLFPLISLIYLSCCQFIHHTFLGSLQMLSNILASMPAGFQYYILVSLIINCALLWEILRFGEMKQVNYDVQHAFYKRSLIVYLYQWYKHTTVHYAIHKKCYCYKIRSPKLFLFLELVTSVNWNIHLWFTFLLKQENGYINGEQKYPQYLTCMHLTN